MLTAPLHLHYVIWIWFSDLCKQRIIVSSLTPVELDGALRSHLKNNNQKVLYLI